VLLLDCNSDDRTKRDDLTQIIPTISDTDELLRYGVCRVPLPPTFDAPQWAKALSQVTPAILAGEGDGEYAFYRNILEEPNFPFEALIQNDSEIGKAMTRHFPIQRLEEELRLDDAFCVHYNMDQDDTSGAKHTDPSDITVNICLQKLDDAQGSQVLFYGSKTLENTATSNEEHNKGGVLPELFLVSQEAGYATIHYGDHPHETMSLQKGTRTNIVLTYCYSDPNRSDVETRTCY
jgi:hypothetical protein